MKRPSLYPCVIAISFVSSVASFQATTPTSAIVTPSSSRLHIVGVETIGIAVVSAAAGAATQLPRIQELEGELVKARAALETSKGEMVAKINELEDKLFQMDQAYEEQSAKFMKEYEQRKNSEVQKITEKIKTDFAYKLEIEVEKEKSRLLSQKLTDVKVSGDQTTKLAEMRIKMDMLESAKEKLEIALNKSETELKRLDKAGKAKSGFWPF